MGSVHRSDDRAAAEGGRTETTTGGPTARPGEVERLASRFGDVKRELVALRDRLRIVGQAARIGLWEYDFERRTLHVSDELAGLYGLTPERFTWSEFAARLHPDDRLDELELPTPSFPFGQVNEYLFRVRHLDGEYRHIRSRSVTHGQGERPLRKLGVHIDMTDDELLTRLNQRLIEHNEHLGRFATTTDRALRGPLGDLAAALADLEQRHRRDLPDEVRESLRAAGDRAGRLRHLVADLRTLAVTLAGGREPELVEPDETVAEAVASVDLDRRVELAPSGEGPQWLDRPALQLCLRHLLDRAGVNDPATDPAGPPIGISVAVDDRWLDVSITGPPGPSPPGDTPLDAGTDRQLAPAPNGDLGLSDEQVGQVIDAVGAALTGEEGGDRRVDDTPSEGAPNRSIHLRWPIEAGALPDPPPGS